MVSISKADKISSHDPLMDHGPASIGLPSFQLLLFPTISPAQSASGLFHLIAARQAMSACAFEEEISKTNP
jgi:hypothetical protein